MKTKKWLLLLLIFILLPGCSKKNTESFQAGADSPDFTDNYLSVASSKVPTDRVLVSESENIALYYDYAQCGIAVKDKRNGYVWKSTENANQISGQEENLYLQNLYKSMFFIEYVRTNEMNKDITTVLSCSKQVVSNVIIEDGKLNLYYRIPTEKIGFKAIISLENDVLKVKIPADGIIEKSTVRIVQIYVLPFLGAAKSGTDGYLFYPDGSGAIMDLKLVNKKSLNQTAKPIEIPIHGNKDTNIDEMMKSNQPYASLPVLGIKNADNAMMGYITQGEADASINVSAENQIVKLNRNYFSFRYRYFYNILSSDISIQGTGLDDKDTKDSQDQNNQDQKKKKSKVIAKVYDYKTIREDREVSYRFLCGNQANYSGMANTYREYLIKSNRLNSTVKDKKQMPLALDLFMGIKKSQVLYQSFLPMTTLQQARQINELFESQGITKQIVRLKGWNKGGYGLYPFNLNVERKIGGNSGMDNYLKFAASHSINVQLDMNFIDASSAVGGFSKGTDIVKSGNTLPLTDTSGDRYLFNAEAIQNKLNKLLQKSYIKNGAGICLGNIGSTTYYDYSKSTLKTKNDCEKQWDKLLKKSSGIKGGTSVSGANSYTFKNADVLFDVPISSSKMQITDHDIPFLQMVLHGYIPYASEAGNLFYDHDIIALKWLEYGCLPYYELTYKKSEELLNTNYSQLFSSYYKQCKDQIISTYKLFQQNLTEIWNSPMISHTYDGDISKVVYHSGKVLYLNYSDKEAVYDGHTIKARSFLIAQEAIK